MNQKDIVERHLRDYGSITPMEALEDYGIYRLAAVVHQLRTERRLDIKTVRRTSSRKNRYTGTHPRYAMYVISGRHRRRKKQAA